MKEVNLYIYSMCKCMDEFKPGCYIGMLEYKGHKKIVSGFIENTTSYRLLITAFIDAVKGLKEPCNINVYMPCRIGLSKIKNKKGAYKHTEKHNYDLLNELSDLLKNNNHKFNAVVTNNYVEILKKECKKMYDYKFKMYKKLASMKDPLSLPDIGNIEETESISDSPIV